MEKTLYSAGFLFDTKKENVVLIQKNKPEKFKGLYNGVGGKVEPGETFEEAMIREFREETGVEHTNWRHFATIDASHYTCKFFMSYGDIDKVTTTTDEKVEVLHIENLHKCIYNLSWLIPMALDREVGVATIIQ